MDWQDGNWKRIDIVVINHLLGKDAKPEEYDITMRQNCIIVDVHDITNNLLHKYVSVHNVLSIYLQVQKIKTHWVLQVTIPFCGISDLEEIYKKRRGRSLPRNREVVIFKKISGPCFAGKENASSYSCELGAGCPFMMAIRLRLCMVLSSPFTMVSKAETSP